MSYKITDNTKAIENELAIKGHIFLRMMTDEVVKISTPKTPKRTGRLRMDVLKQVLGLHGVIHWGKHYAVYQETKQYKNYTTPGTGPHYAENAIRDSIQATGKVAKQAGLV